jgi:hypothetical protein
MKEFKNPMETRDRRDARVSELRRREGARNKVDEATDTISAISPDLDPVARTDVRRIAIVIKNMTGVTLSSDPRY